MSLELVIPGLPSCNTAAAPHWRTRHAERRMWHALVAATVLAELGRWPEAPLERARVTITRCSAGPEPDFDNLASGAKFLLDGLVKAGVLKDDRPNCIGQPILLWERAPRGRGSVRISVETMPASQGVEIGPRVLAPPAQ